MTPEIFDPVENSTRTSCTFPEDVSNYWTANLYFRTGNGTLKRVPQIFWLSITLRMVNMGLKADGGITVYYIPPYDGKSKVTAFKPGFRMLVGDPTLRSGGNQQRQLCHRCFTTNSRRTVCQGGIRTTIAFPTCWDGVNVDSPDHKSHVAYPVNGTFESLAPCPAGHPIAPPQLMYEIIWDMREFNSRDLWPEDGSQPFVYSMGDGVSSLKSNPCFIPCLLHCALSNRN
ncbi:hypothetical protein F4823DRAFT_558344 [Ustulina deusta]|nr:hypothetical protein F4823DRAFT_558344 [Ustulina deusta]